MKSCTKFFFGVLLAAWITAPAYPGDTTDIRITATVIAPPPCTLPSSMNVNFKEVSTKNVSGTRYKEGIAYAVNCGGTPAKVRLQISGNRAGFDDKVLKTSNDNLGIKIYANNSEWDINTPKIFDLTDLPQLEAVLVKANGMDLAEGSFTSSATMVATEY